MKKSLKILIIALVAVIVVSGSLLAVFWENVSNLVAKNTKTPEEYFIYVEKENIDKTAASVYDYLNVEEYKTGYKSGADYSFKVELGDGFSDLANYTLGSSEYVEWLKSLEFSGSTNSSTNVNDVADIFFKIALNEKEIISANYVYSAEKDLYFSIPLFMGEKYAKFSSEMIKEILGYDELDEEDAIISMVNGEFSYSDLLKALPTEEAFAKLVNKYFEILVNNLGKATKNDDTLIIGSVEQKCTLVTIEITEIDMYNALKAIVNEAKTDAEIKDIIEKVALELDEKELYSDFIKFLGDAENELNTLLDDAKKKTEDEIKEEAVFFKTWVDNKGNAVARKLEAEDSRLFFGYAKKGSDISAEAYIEGEEEQKIRFFGEGTLKLDKFTGDFVFESDSKELFKVKVSDLDMLALKKDFTVTGDFTISSGRDLLAVAFEDEEVPAEIKEMVEGCEIKLSLGEKTSFFEVVIKQKSCIKISFSLAVKDYVAPSVPTGDNVVTITTEDELLELFNVDGQEILDKLIEAGVPEELIEGIFASDDSDWEDDEYYDDEYYDDGIEDEWNANEFEEFDEF